MKKIYITLVSLAVVILCGCQEEERLKLGLDSGVDILELVLDQYKGSIDSGKRQVLVAVPEDYNISSMTLTSLKISENAVSTVQEGESMNMNYPQCITVTNGDVYSDWIVRVQRGEVIPDDRPDEGENPDEGGNPDEGEPEEPKEPIDLTGKTKAFIGDGASLDMLGNEAKAAGTWALANYQDMIYIDLKDIKDGRVDMDQLTMIWCHFDWTGWDHGLVWDTRDDIHDWWLAGGNLFASRDGVRYFNNTWRIPKDEKDPNNLFGGQEADNFTIGEGGGGFACLSYSEHPIYQDVPMTGDKNIIYLKSAGCNSTNRTLQWAVDWDPYLGLEGWKTITGGLPLASDMGGDANRVTIAEFPSRDGSGKVIAIGTPFFEWYDKNNAENEYIDNMHLLTKNVINYLSE